MQKSFLSVKPKRVYPVPQRLHSKPSQGKTAKHEKSSRDKVQIKIRLFSLEKSPGSKEEMSWHPKRVTTRKSTYPLRH